MTTRYSRFNLPSGARPPSGACPTSPLSCKERGTGGEVRLALLLFISMALGANADAQRCTGVRAGRVALITGTYVAGEAAAIALRHNDWWVGPTGRFQVSWGGSPSGGQDALLHAAIAYQTTQVATLAWEWACVSPTTAGWLGAITGVAIALPKEIGDGFHATRFSGTDMMWTGIGAVLPALRRSFDPARAFVLKGNYWPSDEYRNRPGGLPQLENDYAGQRYFLAIDPGLVSGGAGPWPDWLGLAFGHSVPQWVSAPPTHEWYATLDISLRGLPVRAAWWKAFATIVDQVKIPLPGVRFRGGTMDVGMF